MGYQHDVTGPVALGSDGTVPLLYSVSATEVTGDTNNSKNVGVCNNWEVMCFEGLLLLFV